ncbi:MAG: hypothetical protein IPM61_00725 [Chlorobi bacterium]|nr:MAG: hypothetical protein UZ07_CHB004001210 [Chlorobi bacterium OLB7]MBK8909831.1 hypothetical protein [Chlorobiota bacterium]MBX7215585.1 hypothetical protein [Candidatus Kapabacteria bacterium]
MKLSTETPARAFAWMIAVAVMVAMMAAAAAGCGGEKTASDIEPAAGFATTATPPPPATDTIPYTIEFVPKTLSGPPLPALQGYHAFVNRDGRWLVVGGRGQGLHTFMQAPATNFIDSLSNHFLWVIDPESGKYWSFDVASLADTLSAPLSSTTAQACYDPATDLVYLIGGYGWLADGSNMKTFNTIISFPLGKMVDAVAQSSPDPVAIRGLIKFGQDDRFAVTGGELFQLGGSFYLVFGQVFNGQYRAFGGSDTGFYQQYTSQVRRFTLNPNTLKILSYGATTDSAFHRRDGNIVASIDPATGAERIAAFGGVFQPGIIGGYQQPVYINSKGFATVDTTVAQKFSAYECPVIAIYDSSGGAIYHTFFGGISHYYYHQTDSQRVVFKLATEQGRNDGLPFIGDISVFRQGSDGKYGEYFLPTATPGDSLVGASIPFIPSIKNFTSGIAYPNGVLKLNALPAGKRTLIGYIYGGILAYNPLPVVPNTGTKAVNHLYEVYLTPKPMGVAPATLAKESTWSGDNLHRR